jgi:hypothetical protein
LQAGIDAEKKRDEESKKKLKDSDSQNKKDS